MDWGPTVKREDGNEYPCPKRKGRTFKAFTAALKRHGYDVEYRILRACDYGAPTIRKRLFLVARCDGQPIVWPEPTHGDPKSEVVKSGRLKPWRTAAECIDWSIPCPSIFERKKPLAEATLRRIAKGIMKYVVNAAEPFIVTYYGDKGGEFRGQGVDEPLKMVMTENRHAVVVPHLMVNTTGHSGGGVKEPVPTLTSGNHEYLVAPTLIQTGYGERKGQSPRVPGLDKPLGTVVAGGSKHALVSAFLTKFRTGSVGSNMDEPLHTVTAGGKPMRPSTGNIHGVVTTHVVKLRGTNIGHDVREPLHTVTAGGTHLGEVRTFLLKYYGNEKDGATLNDPMHVEYKIVDIGMRMLSPRELFRAQGFPDSYVIDRDVNGKPITKTEQVAKCGNSVCPDVAAALVRANVRLKSKSQFDKKAGLQVANV